MSKYLQQIVKLRTFAIIYHLDTGKIMITEKMLLFVMLSISKQQVLLKPKKAVYMRHLIGWKWRNKERNFNHNLGDAISI